MSNYESISILNITYKARLFSIAHKANQHLRNGFKFALQDHDLINKNITGLLYRRGIEDVDLDIYGLIDKQSKRLEF